jgi:uncharacterized membrane protein YhhN
VAHHRRVTPSVAGMIVVATVLAAADWWAVATGRLGVERIAKPAVIVALIVATLALEPAVPERIRLLVLIALGASLIGDVLLLPGGPFLGGVVAFAAAQVAYAAAFSLRPLEPVALVGGAVAGVIVAIAIGRPILRGAPTAMRLPVAAYLVLILAMATLATGTTVPFAVAGAWTFVASDAILAWGRFADPVAGARPGWQVAILATYHVAQGLLVLSLLV